MEYSDEPRLIFSPLSEKEYCEFYDLEMQDYREDSDFYLKYINKDHAVLELGCGSGRLSRHIAAKCKTITGVDVSTDMIDRAQRQSSRLPVHWRNNISYQQMDMLQLDLGKLFDVIIIPYNTLNLLGNRPKILKCLRLCRKHLHDAGILLVHLYLPTAKLLTAPGNKFFQFAIFEKENGEKVVKETVKSYCSESQSLILEERYRLRPLDAPSNKRDLKHTMKLFCPVISSWLELFSSAGFSVEGYWSDHNFSQFSPEKSSALFLHANKNIDG